MKIFVVIATLVAAACAQYDYTPPQRGFNAGGGGTTERPIYGVPNHTPGEPIGPSSSQPALAPPVQAAPAHQNGGGYQQQQESAPAFTQPQVSAPTFSHQAPTFSQQSAPAFSQQSAPTFSHQSAPTFSQQAPSFSQAPAQQQEQQAESYTSKVYRHVYVHSAPDEAPDHQARTIRVPGGDKHVNIIFVKTPSTSSSHQTEVILPEQDEHKNLVYVLLKKGENTADVKIRKPAAAPQPKPQVYFIRYGAQDKQNGGGYQQQQQQPQPQQPQQQQQQQSGGQGGYQQQQSSSGGHGGQGGQGGYQQQGAPLGSIRVPNPIRTPADVPSSGYGLPL
ncbi:glutenin, low molecular weight subunit-like [Folsomia candida]|uniref:DUF243 domain-containing protein n=1 Tax=Folsomia candida TaxID=158441 RepID=A0A226ERP6_FOLCA|nr:glutenin, low molecular weight subunit-like [Folsomia candida]OXA59827.1 hypothetical protein Fcan01_04286 [Folsomia candida]